ncbi:MAG: LysR family transcriptional regulator [Rhizobiaceae bacterium]
MRYTLKQLEYFVAAGETGSIKIASEKINISQPSISTAISHLERELETLLFVRHHAQGLTLTSSGRQLMRETKLLLKKAEDLQTVSQDIQNEPVGELSVGCMITLAPMVIPKLGHDFLTTYPRVQLKMVEGSHEALLKDLRSVQIDAAISYDLQVPHDIEFEALADLPPHVLLAKDHPLSKQSSIELKDLEDIPMVLLDLPYSRSYFFSLFQNEGIQPKIYRKSENHEVVRTMVANGFGFSIANIRPKNLASLDGRKLARVRLKGKHKPMKIGLATLKQEQKPKALKAFEEYCRQMITNEHIPGMSPPVE